MPATKPTKREQRKLAVQAILAKYQTLTKTDDEKAGRAIRKSKRAFQNKKNCPEKFTLEELWDFCDAVHMTSPDRAILLGANDIKQVFPD